MRKKGVARGFLLVLLLFLPICSFSQTTSMPSTLGKADYHIDLYKRKSFWIPLPKRGWLYKDCSVTLLEALPSYATSGEALLNGKSETENATHFLFRFRFVGLYQFSFIYQNYDDEESGYKNGELFHISVFVSDTSRGFKDYSAVYESQPISQAKMLPLIEYDKKASKSADEEVELVKSAEQESNLPFHIKIKEHEFFPSPQKIEELLLEVSITKEPYFKNGALDAFSLALYFLSLNTKAGLQEAHYWFSYVVKRYPSSSLLNEAQTYIDYLSQHYLFS